MCACVCAGVCIKFKPSCISITVITVSDKRKSNHKNRTDFSYTEEVKKDYILHSTMNTLFHKCGPLLNFQATEHKEEGLLEN